MEGMARFEWQQLRGICLYVQALRNGRHSMTDQVLGSTYYLPKEPKIIVLCGSTRFMDVFHEAGWLETLNGNIVLSVGVSKHLPPDHGGESLGQATMEMLDELHWRKIDLADEVLVLNVDGYVGYSTGREIEYAELISKPIRYLEPLSVEDVT
ncbi:hypothetical protein LCGC14_2298040 [marine sediment metagenome]|uniref:Uncharacterized protein n=1 Tax=marine sediment metagenome TaxID=412755 RepID=A0A0F9CPR2_9ZZZZ